MPVGHFDAHPGERVVELREVHSRLAALQEEAGQVGLDLHPRPVQVEPGAFPPDRPAEVERPVEQRLQPVRLPDPAGAEPVVQVLRLEPLVFVEDAAAAREDIAAAFGDDVEEDAGRLDLRTVSGGRNLHFLETVERVVGERRPHRRRVGHIHAVQVVLVLRPSGAGSGEERLLPALLPAHIHLVHEDCGRLFEHRPDVPPVRQVVEHRPIHRLPHPGPPDVQRPPRPRRDDALRHPGER